MRRESVPQGVVPYRRFSYFRGEVFASAVVLLIQFKRFGVFYIKRINVDIRVDGSLDALVKYHQIKSPAVLRQR